MKTIEKTPAVYGYICETCGTEYDKEVAALSCEKSHMQVKGFISKEYHTKDSKYPEIVKVRMEDGTIQMYKSNQYKPESKFEDVTDDAGVAWFTRVLGHKFIVTKVVGYDDNGEIKEPIKGVSIYVEETDGDLNMDGVNEQKLIIHIPENVEVNEHDTIRVSMTRWDDINGDGTTIEDIVTEPDVELMRSNVIVEVRAENMSGTLY